MEQKQPQRLHRREFLKSTSLGALGAAAAANLPFINTVHAAADDPIRVAVIGCGGRGTGAALNVLGAGTKVIYPQTGYHTEDAGVGAQAAARNVEVIALADLFEDRLDRCRQQLEKVGMPIPDDHCFLGFDAYKKVLAIPDVNYVILATPPHFRPMQTLAAIEAGKNVFLEKPAAVDPQGALMIMEAGKLAREKGLGVVAGTQRRHQANYVETVKRLQDGAIGEIFEVRAYWNQGYIWSVDREDGWSDMEWQIRNWNYFTWLSGDHIVEQHLHNIDVCNWVMGTHPVKATSLGGRQARVEPLYGNVYDHFATEFEYANGARMFSQCRQIQNCSNNVSEGATGTKGVSNCANFIQVHGGETWRYRDGSTNPYEQEHIDLINSIRAGEPLNEAQNVAESTLTAIMARMSAYTGKALTWDEVLQSKLDLSPAQYELGPLPIAPVAVPGETPFI
jgi:predicted dehydrogenase